MWWSRGTWPEGTAAWGEPMLQDFPEGLQHMGKAHTGKLLGRRRVELLWADHNHPHATWNMEEVEEGNEGVKQLWKKGLRSRCFRFCLCVSPFSSILIGNQLFFPESNWGKTIIAESPSCFYLKPQSFNLISTFNSVEEGERAVGWVSGRWPRSPMPHGHFVFSQISRSGRRQLP